MAIDAEKDRVRLTAKEAAARLGIKRETLYAYVSRGMITRKTGDDSRTSTFDPNEVDRLARRRRGRRGEQMTATITTSITRISEEGVRYRGREPASFLDEQLPFESVAWWLITGRSLGVDDWQPNSSAVSLARSISSALPEDATALDRLRIAVAAAAAADPLRHDLASPERCAPTIIESMLGALDPLYSDDAVPERLWRALSPAPAQVSTLACMSTALVLLADHGLAASTFAARIAASAHADPYSVVLTGLGPVGGVLHGGASRKVHELYAAASLDGAAEALRTHLLRDPRIPGLGHSVYVERDPRFRVLSDSVRSAYRRNPRLATVLDVYELATTQVHQPPNVDLALGALTFLADMTPDAGEAIFAIARTAGWLAHGAEEYTERPLRLRPQATYVGN
ncbi:MAG: citrate synthase [Acidobacteria bacterium]|nr:citrate synthase [Acidobacteriota bacterium]